MSQLSTIRSMATSPKSPGTPSRKSSVGSTFISTEQTPTKSKLPLTPKEKEAVHKIKVQKNIPSGLILAASYTSAEELIEKNLLEVDDEQKVSLTYEDIKELFRAKCADQNLQYIQEREDRFVDLTQKNCSGLLFSLKEHGLGDESAKALTKILSKNSTYT